MYLFNSIFIQIVLIQNSTVKIGYIKITVKKTTYKSFIDYTKSRYILQQ